MSDARETEQLKQTLREYYNDPSLAEFRPVIQELLDYVDIPESIDIEYLLNLFFECRLSHICHTVAMGAWANAAKYTPKPKPNWPDEY